MNFIIQTAIEHWPFLLATLQIGVLVNVIKEALLTKERAERSKIWFAARSVLPLLGPAIGALLGFFISLDPTPVISTNISGTSAIILYYSGAGVTSAWVVSSIKWWLRKRGVLKEGQDL